jgi:hypothetical protein
MYIMLSKELINPIQIKETRQWPKCQAIKTGSIEFISGALDVSPNQKCVAAFGRQIDLGADRQEYFGCDVAKRQAR